MREIEIKVRVKDMAEIERKLAERGCVLGAPIRQHDTSYTKAGSVDEFEGAKEGHTVLRIRRMDGVNQFNLKQQRTSESDNIEYETEVKDADIMHGILSVMGWGGEVSVKKLRRKGKLGEYEICLDEVERLGSFMEIEKMCEDDADPEKVREELFAELSLLGIAREEEETRGYDTQMYHLNMSK